MKCYLRKGNDYLEDAESYRSKQEAIDAFRNVHTNLQTTR